MSDLGSSASSSASEVTSTDGPLLILTPKYADYTVECKLGSGSFGAAYLVTDKSGGKFVIKEIKWGGKNGFSREDVLRECHISTFVENPNVVWASSFDEDEPRQRCLLFMQFCSGGSLETLIENHVGFMEERKIWILMVQLLRGIMYLHKVHGKHRILHRDIKPDNLFLIGDILYIGDLGLARWLKKDRLADSGKGSPPYAAPEVLREHEYGPEVDVWSAGIVFHQLATRCLPYGDRHIKYAFNRGNTDSPRINKRYPPVMQEIIDKMLTIDGDDRAKILDILAYREMELAGWEADILLSRQAVEDQRVALADQARRNEEEADRLAVQAMDDKTAHDERVQELNAREALIDALGRPSLVAANPSPELKRSASTASLDCLAEACKRVRDGEGDEGRVNEKSE